MKSKPIIMDYFSVVQIWYVLNFSLYTILRFLLVLMQIEINKFLEIATYKDM